MVKEGGVFEEGWTWILVVGKNSEKSEEGKELETEERWYPLNNLLNKDGHICISFCTQSLCHRLKLNMKVFALQQKNLFSSYYLQHISS